MSKTKETEAKPASEPKKTVFRGLTEEEVARRDVFRASLLEVVKKHPGATKREVFAKIKGDEKDKVRSFTELIGRSLIAKTGTKDRVPGKKGAAEGMYSAV